MVQNAARIFGIVYLLIGVLGFVPGLVTPMSDPGMGGMGLLLGLFPINALHNIVHILVGIGGLALAGSLGGARSYFKALAIVYGLLTVLGLIPATSTVFGLVPLGSWDIGLHLVTAALAGYFGFVAVSETTTNRIA
ncbi:MAG: DUF4383 domain-containing protein [Candidatus Eremiobacteraeota bacterium]|nr:DUF4383 domain-containing protein [Candidatus Eremiobacteraeota bacterium]